MRKGRRVNCLPLACLDDIQVLGCPTCTSVRLSISSTAAATSTGLSSLSLRCPRPVDCRRARSTGSSRCCRRWYGSGAPTISYAVFCLKKKKQTTDNHLIMTPKRKHKQYHLLAMLYST